MYGSRSYIASLKNLEMPETDSREGCARYLKAQRCVRRPTTGSANSRSSQAHKRPRQRAARLPNVVVAPLSVCPRTVGLYCARVSQGDQFNSKHRQFSHSTLIICRIAPPRLSVDVDGAVHLARGFAD